MMMDNKSKSLGKLLGKKTVVQVCGGQSGIGAGFLRVLRFPLPIIPPISPSS
jgi:hypothetical protein